MLRPAVEFAWHFMHPDGSYGGEYGSRNTYHFYPHGFEVMAAHEPKAGQIADQFLKLALPHRLNKGPFQRVEINADELQERLASLHMDGKPRPRTGTKGRTGAKKSAAKKKKPG